MDKEVKYFWRSSRNFVSLIYFLNRYIGLFSAFVYLWFGVTYNLIQFILTMQMRHCKLRQAILHFGQLILPVGFNKLS
ncbi:hypothetical protein DFH11DRAFT_1642901 [Phellopilus nigrolimitatus]|nr:hypothetical protein DFH11DRAFT_1642901 [Phellopilus nigrolimitatus]